MYLMFYLISCIDFCTYMLILKLMNLNLTDDCIVFLFTFSTVSQHFWNLGCICSMY